MNNSTTFPYSNPELRLPIHWKKLGHRSIREAMDAIFIKYRNHLIALGKSRELLFRVSEVSKYVMEIHSHLLEGNFRQANQKFSEMIEAKFSTVEMRLPLIQVRSNMALYRIRPSDLPLEDKGELYHIPFHSRNKISTQRYSAPGVPFLYLGSSLYGCWLEVGQPAFHKFNMRDFRFPKTEC